jgi:hypothetical protein
MQKTNTTTLGSSEHRSQMLHGITQATVERLVSCHRPSTPHEANTEVLDFGSIEPSVQP